MIWSTGYTIPLDDMFFRIGQIEVLVIVHGHPVGRTGIGKPLHMLAQPLNGKDRIVQVTGLDADNVLAVSAGAYRALGCLPCAGSLGSAQSLPCIF